MRRLKAATKRRTVQVWHEPENGYWADLKPGLRCTLADTHTCHEDTLAQLETAVALAQPCQCEECVAQAEGREVPEWQPGFSQTKVSNRRFDPEKQGI